MRALLALIFLGVGLFAVRDLVARPATEWMMQYRIRDFLSWGDLFTYLAELRTGIPPLLSGVEVASHLATGGIDWVLTGFYRALFVSVFAIPFIFFASTRIMFGVSYVTSLVFLLAAARIVPENPQVYDLLFPFFFLLFLLGVRLCAASQGKALRVGAGLLAGFALSAFELSRPYALLVVPLLLFHAYRSFRGLPASVWIALLIPLFLFSGAWHAKLWFLQNGQVFWSNYGGENAYRSWSPVLGEVGAGAAAPQAERFAGKRFRGSGEWRSLALDTQWQSERDAKLLEATRSYAVSNPGPAFSHLLKEVGILLKPQTVIFRKYGGVVLDRAPPEGVPVLYAPLVWGGALWMGVGLLVLLGRCVRERSPAALGDASGVIIFVWTVSVVVIAFWESGEEARFLVSLLPLLACYPNVLGLSGSDARWPSSYRHEGANGVA